MDSVVLSGVRGIVLSGVGLSCYQACQTAANPRRHWVCAPLNLSNLTTLTIGREAPSQWAIATRLIIADHFHHQKSGFAGQVKRRFPARRAVP
ncbi:hypothetical protein CSC67_07120 [Pusillimonas caeni]|nr:hypothetical protein CSC67_07120 [Pusillimonas caeni]